AEAGQLGDVDGHRLGERLDLEHARHYWEGGKVALEEPFRGGDALDPDDALRVGVVLYDPVDQQEGPAMRDQRLDLAGRVDRGGLGRRRGLGRGLDRGVGPVVLQVIGTGGTRGAPPR